MEWYESLLLVLLTGAMGSFTWAIFGKERRQTKIIGCVIGLIVNFVAVSFFAGLFLFIDYNLGQSKIISTGYATQVQDCFGRSGGIAIGDYEVTRQNQTWLAPSDDIHGKRMFRTIPEGTVAWVDLPQDKEFNLYLQESSLLWWNYSCYFIECK